MGWQSVLYDRFIFPYRLYSFHQTFSRIRIQRKHVSSACLSQRTWRVWMYSTWNESNSCVTWFSSSGIMYHTSHWKRDVCLKNETDRLNSTKTWTCRWQYRRQQNQCNSNKQTTSLSPFYVKYSYPRSLFGSKRQTSTTTRKGVGPHGLSSQHTLRHTFQSRISSYTWAFTCNLYLRRQPCFGLCSFLSKGYTASTSQTRRLRIPHFAHLLSDVRLSTRFGKGSDRIDDRSGHLRKGSHEESKRSSHGGRYSLR